MTNAPLLSDAIHQSHADESRLYVLKEQQPNGVLVAMQDVTGNTTSLVPFPFSVVPTRYNSSSTNNDDDNNNQAQQSIVLQQHLPQQQQVQESFESQWPLASSSLHSAPLHSISFFAHSSPALANNLLVQHPVITHNLIPHHLQATALAASMHGTPGHAPALIPQPPTQPLQQQHHHHQQQSFPFFPHHQQPIHHTHQQAELLSSAALAAAAAAAAAVQQQQQVALTVQDRPMTQPVYNGVNPQYPGLRVLNTSPPVFAVDNFLSAPECEFLIAAAQDSFAPAPVVGKGAGEISPSRTSSTCYLAREDLPALLHKVQLLTGKPIEHCELPQVGRYLSTQQYMQHYDAFDLSTEDGRRFAMNGGQRVVTVLLYLNTVSVGGATRFPTLNLEVRPVQGTALIFFPATVDGLLDKMALHAALPAVETKYVSQVWIRQREYNGQPSKRLPTIMAMPFATQ